MSEIKFLKPFTRFCMTIGNLPSSYLVSMTYEEQLLWLCDYLEKTVIPTINNNSEVTKEIQELFNQLKNYVEHYFDNLDVQEEINNKLDEMVESGELQQIITFYLDNSYIIEEISTQEFLDNDTNTHYYITKVPNKDKKGNKIKLLHGFANDIETAQVYASETPRSFAKRHNATFCVNASIFGTNPDYENYNRPLGLIINDNHVISNYNFDGRDDSDHIFLLGVKEDNSLIVYPKDTDSSQIIADGCYTTFCAFEKRMENGVILTDNQEKYQWNIIGQNSTTKDLYFICCNGKDINDEEGMSQIQLLTILRDNYNCDFAYRLDCGGSTSHIKNSIMLNQPSDGLGRTERMVPDYIYFAKEKNTIYDYNISDVYNNLGDAIAKANEVLEKVRYLKEINSNKILFKYPNLVSNNKGISFNYQEDGKTIASMVFSPEQAPKTFNIYDNEINKTILRINGLTGLISTNLGDLATIFKNNFTVTDLNEVFETGVVKCATTTLNSPDNQYNWVIITFRVELSGAIQIAIPLRNDQSLTPWKVRFRNANTIGSWFNLLTPTVN